ncbi:MAG TPA: type I secretion system permease/ATPase [Croceibacterium sp.]
MERLLLRGFMHHYRDRLWCVIIASILLNILVFAGSAYSMLVYDSIIPSGSIPTLIALFGILVVVYLFQFTFETLRSEAMLGVANGVHRDLSGRVQHAVVSRALKAGGVPGDGLQPIRDLDQIHAFLSSPGPVALIDLPWVIVFLIVLSLLHWSLGLTALLGAIVLACIAWRSNAKTQARSRDLARTTTARQGRLLAELRHAETAAAMGMRDRMKNRTAALDEEFLAEQGGLSRIVARFGGAGRMFRILLQSLILSVGAALVVQGKATAGITLAASILSGRALAPVDMAIANWRGLVAARSGWSRIVDVMQKLPPPAPRDIALPPPKGAVEVRDLWVAAPGTNKPIVSGVSFRLEPGQGLAIVGPSAAGKTTFAKALLGIWPWLRGDVRLDGATPDQWDPGVLGASFGYVPQNVELLEGTIGENIARFDPDATSEEVIAAARAAGLDDLIKSMSDGYDTPVSQGGASLSAGQRQRIGLATALYGNPHLLVLDEANSNLDAAGDAALANAIGGVRQRGGIVVMITHRLAMLGPVSHVAVMNEGRLVEFGDRDEVLKRHVVKSNAGKPDKADKPEPVLRAQS